MIGSVFKSSWSRARGSYLSAGETVELSHDIVRGVYRGRVFRYFGEVLVQARLLLSGSLVVIFGMVLALGLVAGIEGAYGARVVGAPSLAGAATAIGDLRELGPYAFAYMMAAKVSTGYVAEIGTMRISDEIDALDVIGMDSLTYLASTRLLATWIVVPLIYPIAILFSFLGSYIAVVLQVGEVSTGGYLDLFWKFQSAPDLLFSGIKGMLMATAVVLVGCVYGYRVRGGPVEVGRATAQATVVNLIVIHAIGVVSTQLFWGGQAGLPIGG